MINMFAFLVATMVYTAPPPPPAPVYVTVTAYSEVDSCHYPECVMANGESAHIGAVACPRDIPLETKVELGGVVYTCKDRTAKRYDGRYDVFLGYGPEAHEKALAWGIKQLEIKQI